MTDETLEIRVVRMGVIVAGDAFEIRAGLRVFYRPQGSRGRWAHFLLESNEIPTREQLQAVCAAHQSAGGRPRGGRCQ